MLRGDVLKHYDDLPPHPRVPELGAIHPFIGEAFLDGVGLRVVIIGANAYIGQRDLDQDRNYKSDPKWYADFFEQGSFKFFRAALDDARTVATALVKSPCFKGTPFRGRQSVYLTNAVKRYLPAAEGLKASDIPDEWLAEGARIWSEELECMAVHGVLPHVVIVLGERPWHHVWPAFCEPQPRWVTKYVTTDGELFHFLNHVFVARDARERLLLLLRLRHPAAARYGQGMAAEALVAHADFRRAAAL